jgi:hypothetical protein
VVVHDLDISRVSCIPGEADPPLVIDSNAELTGAIPHESLQAIRRRNSKILECACSVDHPKLSKGDALDVSRQFSRPCPLKDFLGLFVPKGTDHCSSL